MLHKHMSRREGQPLCVWVGKNITRAGPGDLRKITSGRLVSLFDSQAQHLNSQSGVGIPSPNKLSLHWWVGSIRMHIVCWLWMIS